MDPSHWGGHQILKRFGLSWLWKYMKIRKTLWKTNIQPTQKCQENVPRITGSKRHSDAFTCLLIINECDGRVQQAFSLALGQSQNANQNFVVFTHWKERLFHKAFHFLCWAFNLNLRRTSKNIEEHRRTWCGCCQSGRGPLPLRPSHKKQCQWCC
jgi:hypothetical protein